MLNTDFWWLSSEEARHYGHVDLFHQEPYSDEPDTDREPLSHPMVRSDRRYPLESIRQWKAKFRNINVFRSFGLYSSDTNGAEVIGPFLLDIDRIIEKDGGYIPDLGKALEDTRILVTEYCSNFNDKNYRVFFTGHKGFHIEIDPKAICISLNINRRPQFESRRKEINEKFGDAFVDRFHDHVRLHNSVNRWIDYSGQTLDSMNFEISINELFGLSAEDIFVKAKSLALEALEL